VRSKAEHRSLTHDSAAEEEEEHQTMLMGAISSTFLSLKVYIWTRRTIAGQRIGKHIPAANNTLKKSDNFRCCATRCKYNSRGRGVFYVVRIYPLLGNGYIFYGSASNLYK
jgi:hypothetical protein